MSRWIEEIRHGLRLSPGGVLLLVDHAIPEKLGPLVRALLADDPDLDVLTEVAEIPQMKDGAAFVLAPEASDAAWLNANRPIFARKSLKVVLFCAREVSEALAQRAPDFYDWIAHRQECPAGAAEHAILGIRGALRARAPGITFIAHNHPERVAHVERMFHEALPGRRLRWLKPGWMAYAELVRQIREAGREWVACDAANYETTERFRWALAEARRRTRAILVLPEVFEDRFWVVSDACWPSLGGARALLARAGARHPGRLAAAAGLETPAITALIELLARGYHEEALLGAMLRSPDAGTGLAERILSAGIDPNPLQGWFMLPPVQRHLGKHIGLRRKFPGRAPREVEGWIMSHQVADRGFPLLLRRASDVVELLLCEGARTPERWIDLARLALKAGDGDVAATWAERALETRRSSEAYLLHGIALAEHSRLNWEAGRPAADRLRLDALRSLERAEETLDPSTPVEDELTLHALRAELLLHLGLHVQAKWSLHKALRLVDLPSARVSDLHRIARLLRQTGQADRAEEILKGALERATNAAERARIQLALGFCALALGRADEAYAIAQELLADHPRRADADAHANAESYDFQVRMLRSRAHMARQEPREALEEADQLLHFYWRASRGKVTSSLFFELPMLATSLNRAGRARDAEAVLRKLLGLPVAVDKATTALGLESRETILAFLAGSDWQIRMAPSVRDDLWNDLVLALRAQGRHLEADDMERRRYMEAAPPEA